MYIDDKQITCYCYASYGFFQGMKHAYKECVCYKGLFLFHCTDDPTRRPNTVTGNGTKDSNQTGIGEFELFLLIINQYFIIM